MKFLYFLPAIFLVIVVLLVDDGWVKTVLLSILAISLLVAKYFRNQPKDEIEYDERVKSNIHYFSFGFILIMNTLLICYILLTTQFEMNEWLNDNNLLIYLVISIFVPLYIIPNIAKRL